MENLPYRLEMCLKSFRIRVLNANTEDMIDVNTRVFVNLFCYIVEEKFSFQREV